jgi:large subunit ribosomal protein L4
MATKAKKYDTSGKESGSIDLSEKVFGEDRISEGAIHAVIRAELRNRRQGTHKTKGISEIRGGGKKPWRQKGTGYARQGSNRATQWRGGQTVFGPVPRDYTIKLPVAQRRAGIRSILAKKCRAGSVSVISDVTLDKFSTRQMYSIFKTMGQLPGNTVAFIVDSEDAKVKKSLMNIPSVAYQHARRLNAPELYYAGHLVISESALKYLEASYGSEKPAAQGVQAK